MLPCQVAEQSSRVMSSFTTKNEPQGITDKGTVAETEHNTVLSN